VIFADYDQYLLAPRESARRAAVTAVGKAGRLVGSRREGRGLVIVQTRRGDDAVVARCATASFDGSSRTTWQRHELLGLAPYGASAEVTGEGAAEFVAGLTSEHVTVSSPTPTGYSSCARRIVETLTRRSASAATRGEDFAWR
jgi:primosomal protein N'